jgi:phage tail P2-like protein
VRNLADIHFLDLLPPSLADDEHVQAIAAGLDDELQALIAALPGAAILPNIATVPERILDLLAVELSIDNYQQSYTLAQKRALVAVAVIVHRHKGTPSAVRQEVEAIWGDGMTLQEWFEYGGAPYHFRLIGASGFAGVEQQTAWIAAVSNTKNARSVLDGVVVTAEESHTIYAGFAVHFGVRQTFTQGA